MSFPLDQPSTKKSTTKQQMSTEFFCTHGKLKISFLICQDNKKLCLAFGV